MDLNKYSTLIPQKVAPVCLLIQLIGGVCIIYNWSSILTSFNVLNLSPNLGKIFTKKKQIISHLGQHIQSSQFELDSISHTQSLN